MPKPWEYDWSGGDLSALNLLPIMPFLGRQRPPMLGEDGQPSGYAAMPAAGSYPAPSFDPMAPQPPGSSDPSAAVYSVLAAAGPSAGAAADALASPGMAAPQSFGPGAVAQQSPGPANDANAFLQPQLQQATAVTASPAQDLMPQSNGYGAQSRLQPAVYSGWSGASTPSPTLASPSQADPAPAHVTLAQGRATFEGGVPDIMPLKTLAHGTAGQRRDGSSQHEAALRAVPGLIIPQPFDRYGVVNRPLWFRQIETAGERSKQSAVSSQGAMGVMQVTLAGAKDVQRIFGIPVNTHLLKTDEKYNRRIGQTYANYLLNHYNGNVVLATAAYNWGMGHVYGLTKLVGDPREGKVSDEDFTLKIPNQEARDYIRRVVYGETWDQQDQRRRQRKQQEQSRTGRRPPPLLNRR